MPAKRRKPRLRSRSTSRDNFTERSFAPYALAIGQVSLAWNDLCDVLAGLFSSVLGDGASGVPLALWHTLKADRTQIQMLKELVAVRFPKGGRTRLQLLYPELTGDINWLLERAGNLEDARNNVVHAPLASQGAGKDAAILPRSIMKNVRAKNLEALIEGGVNLLTYFRRCRARALFLRDYASQVDDALWREGVSWPQKPVLPELPRPIRSSPVRRNPGSPPRQPRPSRA